MSRLGDFLERVFGPRDYFATVQAKVRHWQDRLYADLASDAWAQHLAALRGTEASPAQGGWTPEDGPRECVNEVRVWLEGADRGREEVRHVTGEWLADGTWILNGDRLWVRNQEHSHRLPFRPSHALSRAGRHFRRVMLRNLFAGLVLEERGTVERLGVECIRVHATPLPHHLIWSHQFPTDASEYELHVDPDRVVVLAIIAGFDRGIFETNEVTEVTYDKTINPTRFTIPKRARR